MKSTISDGAQQAKDLMHAHIIKNTFIEVVNRRDETNRRGSIPASLRLCLEERLPYNHTQSDASTTTDCSPPWSPASSLRSKDSDTSCQQVSKSGKHCYRAKTERLLKRTVKKLESCDLLAHVEASYGFQDCSIHVQVKGDDEKSIDQASAFVKKVLLDTTSESNCIYIMGYCSPKAFVTHSMGFDVTLAAMENASKACWHVFKKNFCRHEGSCSKQHPVYKMPLRVFIDAVRPSAPVVQAIPSADDFRLLLAGLVHTLTTTLEQNPLIDCVRTKEESSSESWTIELHPRGYVKHHEECLLTPARNQLLKIINASRSVEIVEHGGWSFVPKSNGFVVLLGEASSRLQCTTAVPVHVVVKTD